MKSNCFSKQTCSEKSGGVLCFANLFKMSGLIEHSWVLLSASAFSLLQYVVLIQVYEENMASHRFFEKGSGLRAFPDNYQYSSL